MKKSPTEKGPDKEQANSDYTSPPQKKKKKNKELLDYADVVSQPTARAIWSGGLGSVNYLIEMAARCKVYKRSDSSTSEKKNVEDFVQAE